MSQLPLESFPPTTTPPSSRRSETSGSTDGNSQLPTKECGQQCFEQMLLGEPSSEPSEHQDTSLSPTVLTTTENSSLEFGEFNIPQEAIPLPIDAAPIESDNLSAEIEDTELENVDSDSVPPIQVLQSQEKQLKTPLQFLALNGSPKESETEIATQPVQPEPEISEPQSDLVELTLDRELTHQQNSTHNPPAAAEAAIVQTTPLAAVQDVATDSVVQPQTSGANRIPLDWERQHQQQQPAETQDGAATKNPEIATTSTNLLADENESSFSSNFNSPVIEEQSVEAFDRDAFSAPVQEPTGVLKDTVQSDAFAAASADSAPATSVTTSSGRPVMVTPAITESVINQVMETLRFDAPAIQTRTIDEGHQLSMQINPAEFGRLEIVVDSSSDIITAQIIASEAVTSELLVREKAQLINALQEQGIDLPDVDISHRDPRDLDHDSSANQQRNPFGQRPNRSDPMLPPDTQSEILQSIVSTNRVDLVA